MEKGMVQWGKVLSFAGAFVAFLIGSGFATGQEILQYFVSYGYQGFLVGLAILLLFVYTAGSFICAGKRENFDKGSDIFPYYCGKHIGAFYDYFTIAFVFMSYVVMIAGAGATMNESYGLPEWVGSCVMMALVCVTTIFGLKGIIDVIGKLGPFIAIFSVVLGLYAYMSNAGAVPGNVERLLSGEIEVMQAGTSWVTSASSYVGFCMLWLAAFLAAMGKTANSKREALWGTTLGAFGFTFGCVAMMMGLLAFLPEVAGTQIPSLILAEKLIPIFATVFTVIILAGIFTTSVPLLWQVSSRFTVEGSSRFKTVTIVCAVVGTAIALVLPFNKLVNIIYVINGYVGILLLAFIIVKDVRRMVGQRKGK